MKENRKLLKEVLKDIRHDMTDEEVFDCADIWRCGEMCRSKTHESMI